MIIENSAFKYFATSKATSIPPFGRAITVTSSPLAGDENTFRLKSMIADRKIGFPGTGADILSKAD
jgi:hypothetical protein